jgi:hypothetical protein
LVGLESHVDRAEARCAAEVEAASVQFDPRSESGDMVW